jgi:hypothetical protein
MLFGSIEDAFAHVRRSLALGWATASSLSSWFHRTPSWTHGKPPFPVRRSAACHVPVNIHSSVNEYLTPLRSKGNLLKSSPDE